MRIATAKMSLFSVLTIILTSTASQAADPHYSMTVVKEAWVAKPGQPVQPQVGALACQTAQSISAGVAKMGWVGDPTPEKVTQINPDVALWIMRNGEEVKTDTVVVWMEVKKGKSSKYYALTDIIDIDYERSQVPQMKFENGMLVLEAYTKTYDPSIQVLERTVPDYYGQTYQTVKLGSLNDKGLELQTLNCNR